MGGRAAIILSLTIASTLISLPTSYAAGTCDDYQINVLDLVSYYGPHGSRTVNYLPNHYFDYACPDVFVDGTRFASATFITNGAGTYQAFVGYLERSNLGPPIYTPYAYWRVNGVFTSDYGADVTGNVWARSKVYYASSDGRWHFEFDHNNDGSYVDITPPHNVYFTTGYAYAYTFTCCDNTSHYDHHTGLRRQTDGSGTWSAWQDNAKNSGISNVPPLYYYKHLANDEYEIGLTP